MTDQSNQRRGTARLVGSICILAYGALVTFGALVVVGIGNAFAMNAGDGSASVHRTSEHVVWPVAVFYAISAAGPYVRDPGRRGLLFVAALAVLLIGLVATVELAGRAKGGEQKGSCVNY